jgi:RNA-binding protein PNO1
MSPIVEYLKLQIRFNPATRSVELKTSELTEDAGAIQKAQDFVEVGVVDSGNRCMYVYTYV